MALPFDSFDPLELITYVSLAVGAIVGFLQIKSTIKKQGEERDEKLRSSIVNTIERKIGLVDERFKNTDRALIENKEDIEDVEDDVKNMAKEFKEMCDVLSKHNYVIEDLIPDFKSLKTEFYKFKTAVDINLLSKKSDITINTDSDMEN